MMQTHYFFTTLFYDCFLLLKNIAKKHVVQKIEKILNEFASYFCNNSVENISKVINFDVFVF